LRYVYLFVFDFRYNRTYFGSFLGVSWNEKRGSASAAPAPTSANATGAKSTRSDRKVII